MSAECDLEELREKLTAALNRAHAAERSLENERVQARVAREARKAARKTELETARDHRLRGNHPDRKSIREVGLEQVSKLRRYALEPWYINIDADWWDEARREWDPRLDGPGPATGPAGYTYLGLPVMVWAPGSRASGGLTVHAYPPGFRSG